ncbi:hypothetical protein RUND412_000352 [Rhizina undulata]
MMLEKEGADMKANVKSGETLRDIDVTANRGHSAVVKLLHEAAISKGENTIGPK